MDSGRTEQIEPKCGWKQHIGSAVKITVAKYSKGYRCLGEERKGVLKLFETLPAISQIPCGTSLSVISMPGFLHGPDSHMLSS